MDILCIVAKDHIGIVRLDGHICLPCIARLIGKAVRVDHDAVPHEGDIGRLDVTEAHELCIRGGLLLSKKGSHISLIRCACQRRIIQFLVRHVEASHVDLR